MAAKRHEFGMGAPLGHLPAIEQDDFLTIADRAQTMGDDDAGAAALAQMVIDLLLCNRVEGSGRFIEHNHARVLHEGASNLEALALSATEIRPLLGNGAVIATRTGGNLVVDMRVLRRTDHRIPVDGCIPQSEVLVDGAFEQENILIDRRDRRRENGTRNLG